MLFVFSHRIASLKLFALAGSERSGNTLFLCLREEMNVYLLRKSKKGEKYDSLNIIQVGCLIIRESKKGNVIYFYFNEIFLTCQ